MWEGYLLCMSKLLPESLSVALMLPDIQLQSALSVRVEEKVKDWRFGNYPLSLTHTLSENKKQKEREDLCSALREYLKTAPPHEVIQFSYNCVFILLYLFGLLIDQLTFIYLFNFLLICSACACREQQTFSKKLQRKSRRSRQRCKRSNSNELFVLQKKNTHTHTNLFFFFFSIAAPFVATYLNSKARALKIYCLLCVVWWKGEKKLRNKKKNVY